MLSEAEQTDLVVTDSPPLKKFRHLSEMIRQRLENEEQNLAIVEVDEIECYMACKATDDDEDPLNYRTKNASIYGKLSPIAQDILSVPASSTPLKEYFQWQAIVHQEGGTD